MVLGIAEDTVILRAGGRVRGLGRGTVTVWRETVTMEPSDGPVNSTERSYVIATLDVFVIRTCLVRDVDALRNVSRP